MPRVAIALLLVVFCGDAAAQEAGRYTSDRPHSTLRIRDRDGVAVTRLQATTKRVGPNVVVRVVLDARLRRGTRRAATLHVGTCVGGPSVSPRCPSRVSRRISLGRSSRTTRLTARLPLPPARIDAIAVSLGRPSRGLSPSNDPGTYGYLQIQGEGWRGRGAGRTYGGVVEPLDGFDVHELHLDAIGLGPREARSAVLWSVSSDDPARVGWRCTVGACGGETFRLRGDGDQNGAGPLVRDDIETDGSPTMGIVGTTGGRRLFSVRLPTPLL